MIEKIDFCMVYSGKKQKTKKNQLLLFLSCFFLGGGCTGSHWLVDLGVMAIKEYSKFFRSLELEPRHQMQFNVIPSTPFLMEVVLPLCQRYSQCILGPATRTGVNRGCNHKVHASRLLSYSGWDCRICWLHLCSRVISLQWVSWDDHKLSDGNGPGALGECRVPLHCH